MGDGARFGPLQKISPSLVRWSSGKVCSSCEMLSWNFSRNSMTAKRAHPSKDREARKSRARLMAPSRASCDVPLPSARTFSKSAAGPCKKALISRGPSTNSCSNMSRDHSMVCSMALGKCFKVHKGMDSSGGSWESEYDCVMCGRTTCEFAFVPSVPDSSKGLQNQTQRESTYMRACTLSNAFTTESKPDQKLSSKGPSSVSWPTRISKAWTLSDGFIFCTALAAAADFDLPTSCCLNRN
mmetsp:Transcript_76380/g.220749  ORF Transcript_76380/g.220749 Transcript_76380/m.220749 type:complete len:240 (+) Transcript_76380:910-1629(+)